MEPILQKILESTFTLSQLKHRVRILHEYLSEKLFTNNKTSSQVEPEDLVWLNSLGGSFLDQFNINNLDQIFKDLEDYLQKIKPLIIYLAFEPNEELNHQIGLYLRQNSSHKIFDAKMDPNLIAGCALSLNGIYKDYSLKVKITQEKEKILANFKKFLQ